VHFQTLAELLADECTVVTYDRRGKRAQSPLPVGRILMVAGPHTGCSSTSAPR
jgi:hypothetical protein